VARGGVSHPRVRASHDGRTETHPVARMQPRQAHFHTMYHNSYPCEGALPVSGVFPSIPSGTSFERGNGDPVCAPKLLPRTFFEKGKHASVRVPELLLQSPRLKQVHLSPLQRPVDPPPTISAAMVSLPQEESSDSDQPNSKRSSARRAHAAYLSEMKNAHTEGRRARHIIQTNEQGIIIGLRTK
jgi:hypothetical protein